MASKNPSFRTTCIFALITVLLFPLTVLLAEISGVEIANMLIGKDQIFNTSGYKISFIVTTKDNQFNDPNQGMVYMDCEATWTGEGLFAMKITYHYEHTPVFGRLGSCNYTPIDYDQEGNLIVWRIMEKYILSAPERNESVLRIESTFVDPNGKLLNKGSSHTKLRRYPPSNHSHMYEFNQSELAAGVGFSKHLGAITSVKPLPLGLIKTTSQGSFGPSLRGTWELTVDPNEDYIVRKALFTQLGRDEPTIVVTSNGLITKDGLTLAKHGTFKYSNFLDVSVEVTDISKVAGANALYEEVLSRLNEPLPPGSQIMDRRGDKPVITTVE